MSFIILVVSVVLLSLILLQAGFGVPLIFPDGFLLLSIAVEELSPLPKVKPSNYSTRVR